MELEQVKKMSKEAALVTIQNTVYDATFVFFEQLRVAGKISGDGHTLAQELAEFASKKVDSLWKEPKLKEKILNASNVHKIEWDDNNLIVQFNNGGRYQYLDIPAEISIGMSEAKSPGSYLNREIKGKYRYTRID